MSVVSPKVHERFARELKKLCKPHGAKQEVCACVGITFKTLARWQNYKGEVRPKVSNVHRAVALLGLDRNFVFRTGRRDRQRQVVYSELCRLLEEYIIEKPQQDARELDFILEGVGLQVARYVTDFGFLAAAVIKRHTQAVSEISVVIHTPLIELKLEIKGGIAAVLFDLTSNTPQAPNARVQSGVLCEPVLLDILRRLKKTVGTCTQTAMRNDPVSLRAQIIRNMTT